MKLTLRRTRTTVDHIRIEDEIFLEDDSPPMVQYNSPDNNEKIDSYSLPPDTLDMTNRLEVGQIEDPRLLLCPFCGNRAAVYMPRHRCYAVTCLEYKETFTEKWDRSKTYCYCRIGGDGLEYATIDAAIEAWNRRIIQKNGLT